MEDDDGGIDINPDNINTNMNPNNNDKNDLPPESEIISDQSIISIDPEISRTSKTNMNTYTTAKKVSSYETKNELLYGALERRVLKFKRWKKRRSGIEMKIGALITLSLILIASLKTNGIYTPELLIDKLSVLTSSPSNPINIIKNTFTIILLDVYNRIIKPIITFMVDLNRTQPGREMIENTSGSVVEESLRTWKDLVQSMRGSKTDALIPLSVTSLIIPIFKRLHLSPILGFLIAGTILGPSCLNTVADTHTLDYLGEIGIVFFLFEMGLELSVSKLMSMKKDVFGLGLSQFVATAALVYTLASKVFKLSGAAAATIGGGLALSSSAFVLQLLKDKKAMGTRHGRASFGILLLQDLAVVPVLIVIELLGKGTGTGLAKALGVAATKAIVCLSAMAFAGRKLLDPIFYLVAKSKSQEAFLSITLCVVLLMSFVTEGIGLSGTLGAFMAGLLLAETRYVNQVETDIKPFRGILLGFFFIAVGFSIDLSLLSTQPLLVAGLVSSLIASKAAITTALAVLFGVSFSSAQQTGLMLAQGSEFAFVAFNIAEKMNVLTNYQTRLLMTSVALSMALTPFLSDVGGAVSSYIEKRSGFSHYYGGDSPAKEVKSDTAKSDFVIICGFGRVGKMVADILDRKLIRYIAIDSSPRTAIDARNKGLPVFYGDINRNEILRSFNADKAKTIVVTVDDMSTTNRVVVNIRKDFPNIPLVVRAKDSSHQSRLSKMFTDIKVLTPVIPEDSVLLTLPFGGAVLQQLGVTRPEISAVLEDARKKYMEDDDIDDAEFDFLEVLQRRLPKSSKEGKKVEKDKERREIDHEQEEQDELIKESLLAAVASVTAPAPGHLSSGLSLESAVHIDQRVNDSNKKKKKSKSNSNSNSSINSSSSGSSSSSSSDIEPVSSNKNVESFHLASSKDKNDNPTTATEVPDVSAADAPKID